MKRKILAIATIFILTLTIITTQAQASGLTQTQINAIIGLLQSFGADQQVINNVRATLQGNGNSYSYTQYENSPEQNIVTKPDGRFVFKTWYNNAIGFKTSVPASWKVSDYSVKADDFKISDIAYSGDESIVVSGARISVSLVDNLSDKIKEPQKYVNFQKSIIADSSNTLRWKIIQLDDRPAILSEHTTIASAGTGWFTLIRTTYEGREFMINFAYDTPSPENEHIIEKFISDFRFTNKHNTYGSAVSNTQVITNTDNTTTQCTAPNLYRNLYLGTKGSDVSQLQQYLKEQGFYTYPEITGYYGPATQQAVQRFQCSKMGICSGTPWTTGYGMVGPATRERMRCDYPSADTNNLGGPIIYNIKTQTYPSGFPSRVVTFNYDRMPRNVYKVALVSNSKGAVYLSDIRPTGGHLVLQVPETAPAGVYHLNVFDSKNNLLLRSEDFVLTKSSRSKTISPKIIEFKLTPFNITPGQPFIATWVTQGNVRQCNITEVTGPTYYNVGTNGSKTLTTTVRHGLARFRLSCVTNDNRSIYADANVLLDDSNINSSYNVTNDELTMYHIGACGISLSFFKGADLQEECSKQGSETSFILRNGGYILKGNFLVQDLDILSNDNNLGNHDKLKLAAFNLGVQMGINIWEEMKKQIKNDSAVLYHYENDIYSDTIFKSQNNKKVAVLILREYKREKVDVLLTLEPQYGQNTNYEILTNISKKILNSMAITKSTMSEVQLHKWLKDAMQ